MADDIEKALDKLAAHPTGEKKKLGRPAVSESIELTAAEKSEIEAEAQAEVTKELKAEKRKEFKAAAKQKLKRQTLIRHGKDEAGEDTEMVMITLAPFQPFLQIDGARYYPNRSYRMGRGLAAVVKEQMYRGELHDAEVHGKKMSEFYGQRPRNLQIGPNTPIPADAVA